MNPLMRKLRADYAEKHHVWSASVERVCSDTALLLDCDITLGLGVRILAPVQVCATLAFMELEPVEPVSIAGYRDRVQMAWNWIGGGESVPNLRGRHVTLVVPFEEDLVRSSPPRALVFRGSDPVSYGEYLCRIGYATGQDGRVDNCDQPE